MAGSQVPKGAVDGIESIVSTRTTTAAADKANQEILDSGDRVLLISNRCRQNAMVTTSPVIRIESH